MSEKTQIICLTPVKNEEWIIGRFLECASLWADHIIVLDQHSEDRTCHIASSFPKVSLHKNQDLKFNESDRQKTLIELARKIPGKKILIALDADEILSADSLDSTEWNSIRNSRPGTVLKFHRFELYQNPGQHLFEAHWDGGRSYPFGFVDDGSEHKPIPFHSCRLPTDESWTQLILLQIKVLHYQNCSEKRKQSKLRWYYCFEQLNPDLIPPGHKKNWVDRYRAYWPSNSKGVFPLPPYWYSGYCEKGIDMFSVLEPPYHWWDVEVLRMIVRFGPARFRSLDIWNVDWNWMLDLMRSRSIPDLPVAAPIDPRRLRDRFARMVLRNTKNRFRCLGSWFARLLTIF